MGMFTSIIHPSDGRELQIKCGFDNMESYKVGDIVEWELYPDKPGEGKLLDGVYQSWSDKGLDDYVVIKDHKVVFVIPKPENQDSDYADRYERELAEKLGIVSFNREWWTESAWIEKEIREDKFKLKYLQEKIEFLKTLVGKSDKEIKEARRDFMMRQIASRVNHMINYAGFARLVLKEEKMLSEDELKEIEERYYKMVE